MEELKVLLVAMLPISELRGAIPLALLLGIPLEKAIVLSVLGNFIPVPVLLLFLKKFEEKIILKYNIFKKIYLNIVLKVRRKTRAKVERYGVYALILFTAIPLPFTGAYTACLASYLFGLNIIKSLLAIFLGIIIAAVIVSLATFGVAITL